MRQINPIAAIGVFVYGLCLSVLLFVVAAWLIYPTTDYYKLADLPFIPFFVLFPATGFFLGLSWVYLRRQRDDVGPWTHFVRLNAIGLSFFLATGFLFRLITAAVHKSSAPLPGILVGPPIILAAMIMFAAMTTFARVSAKQSVAQGKAPAQPDRPVDGRTGRL